MSTAGARRRYQRTLPSVIARIAARCGEDSKGVRAASDDRPSTTIETMARAASASAGAPGAQGVLTKTAACQLDAASEIGGRYHSPAGALHLAQGKLAATALNNEGVVTNRDDRAGICDRTAAISGKAAAFAT